MMRGQLLGIVCSLGIQQLSLAYIFLARLARLRGVHSESDRL